MRRVPAKFVLCLSLPCVAGGCAGHGAPQADAAASPPRPGMASRSAAAGVDTFDVAYHGVGGAIRAPFKDFNIAHDRIPAVLMRAAAAPYDTRGLKGCAALTEEIAALDLALGPDLDTPDLETSRDVYAKGAGLAADAALDAMRGAAVAYIPMRGVVRKLSGADKLERRTKKAVLAGSVRRGFLKALGMERGCAWPAAPLGAEVASAPSAVVIATGPVAAPSPSTPRSAAIAVPVVAVSSPAIGSVREGLGGPAFASSVAAPGGVDALGRFPGVVR